jgi:hypothetical protein
LKSCGFDYECRVHPDVGSICCSDCKYKKDCKAYEICSCLNSDNVCEEGKQMLLN